MNKKIYYISPLLLILLLVGCSKVEQTESGLKITDNKILTDNVSYVDGDSEITIHRNKAIKKASVSMNYKIKDEDEYGDFLGQKMTFTPFLINITCAMFNTAIFNPEALEETRENDDSEINDNKMNSYLEGYETNKISINFIDAEDNKPIASCESVQAGNENINFDISRDYSEIGSMFGAEIGKYENQEDIN